MTLEELHRIFTDIPQIETERLILRRLRPSDALDVYEYASSADTTR